MARGLTNSKKNQAAENGEHMFENMLINFLDLSVSCELPGKTTKDVA